MNGGFGKGLYLFSFCLGCVHAMGVFIYLCCFNVALILLWEGGGFIIDGMEMDTDMDMEMEMENENRILLQSRRLTRIASAVLFCTLAQCNTRATDYPAQRNRAQPPIAPTQAPVTAQPPPPKPPQPSP